ncbi:hybrid sensor histidine kinase/response regulator transcription factor [Wenyingzhuangia sp. 2_MG-2023]|uniref:hybrid sensor histidine kinase/response regulator transcription factor n=1 Tax=Wenyingzhuangia sp. 2_MG-2023 TaxID=3062639 RepID=UPI0026E212C9|nr:hybrid sensor histidine kinase/response regulator transcription factor [Wenyingzhuangia sp. 2_MG-2023]MDO6738774.1 ATP-binding protein [Wenyingzhuangia sp. 2_MG-2023]
MKKNHFLVLCFFLFLVSNLNAQKDELRFYKSLNISNGLTHNGVTSVFKDSKGFVWIGTYDGLNKYDGFSIKQYKNTYKKDILTSNRVRAINENDNGDLLIGTDNGLTVYNFKNEKFTKISTVATQDKENEPIIIDIKVHPKTGDIICITENKGLYVYNQDFTVQGNPTDKLSYYRRNRKFIYEGVSLDEDTYLYVTTSQMLQYNTRNKQCSFVNEESLKGGTFIEKVDDHTLIVGLSDGGLRFVNFKLENDKYIYESQKIQLTEYKFVCANIDNKGKLWLGEINSGVYKISDINAFKEHKNYTIQYFKANSNKLRSSTIVDFNAQYSWLGSFDKGVYLFDLNKNPFKELKVPARKFLNIVPITATSFSLGGVDMNGLGNTYTLYDIKKGTYTDFPIRINNNEKETGNIVLKDSRDDIWVSFTGSMHKYIGRIKKGTQRIEKIEVGDEFLGGLRSIVEDKSGNIWLAYTNGIFKINITKGGEVAKIEDLRENPHYQNSEYSTYKFLYVDPLYHYLWIGDKTSGLIRVELQNSIPIKDYKLTHFLADKDRPNAISNNFISSIYRTKEGDLWIGTEGGGICKVEKSNTEPKFIPYTEDEGLSNNVVKSILGDDNGDLWISTNNGLNKFDTKKLIFRNFTKQDGLPFEDFYYFSRKLKSGWFVFVGNESLCYFDPNEISRKEPLPRLEFAEFRLFNKVVHAKDTVNDRILLEKHISYLNHIELEHNENVFSIEVVPLHYSNPKNHIVKYKLSPLNEDWVELKEGQKVIEFNGLQPGNYSLKAKASNSLQEWTEPKELNFTIAAPYWKSNIAYVAYVLGGFIIIYIVFSIFLKIQALSHEIEIEQIENDNLKDVNEYKLRFFSNITHEIKTPITLILGPIDFVINKLKSGDIVNIEEKLSIVKRQAKRISQLIDQVQEFQKSDTKQLKMNYETFSFDLFFRDMVEDFKFLSDKENKTLNISGDAETIYVSADKDKLEKIFINILSNSFKYTKTEDKIEIDYKRNANNLVLTFKDTGKGIDIEDLPHVFERFYQSKKMSEEYIGGSGIGLAFSKRLVEMHYGYINVESELGVGTTIHIILPIIHEGIVDNQELDKVLKLEEEYEAREKPIELEKVDYSILKSDKNYAQSRVFYAEDNLDMRNFVSEILSNFFEVKTFSNGAECLEAMNDDWPDLVLSDVLMPELNGFELCKSIKENVKTSHIPVVLLTACVSMDEQIQGIDQGADAYIKKPFNTQRLVTTIEAILRGRKQLRERFKVDFPLELEKKKESKKDIAFIEKLYDLMSENLDNKDLDMDNLAKHLYLNRTHFYQKVKALTNQTPFELLKDYRLKKAAEFLVREKMTVNEVFIATGFKSRSHFSKVFKDKYNVTPGQYVNRGMENLENNKEA